MADKEEYTLKIMIEPKNSPCEFCKGCSWFERCESTCEKLAAFNNKIICQEYDYDKAIEVIAEEMQEAGLFEGAKFCAEVALKALLGGVKKCK